MKKNKKQRFISDKVKQLKKEGKNEQESIAIAMTLSENMFQGKEGSSTFKKPPTVDMNNPDLPEYYKATAVRNPKVVPTETINGTTYEISRLGSLHPLGSLVPTKFGAVKKDAPMLATDLGSLQTTEIADNKANPNRNVQSIFELNRGWIVDEKGNRVKKVDIGEHSKYYEGGGEHLPKYQDGVRKFDPAYNSSLYSTYTQKNPDSYYTQQRSSVNLTPQSSTPGNELWANPYAPNNAPMLGAPLAQQQNNYQIGQLPTFNTEESQKKGVNNFNFPTSYESTPVKGITNTPSFVEDEDWLQEQRIAEDKPFYDNLKANSVKKEQELQDKLQTTRESSVDQDIASEYSRQTPPIQFANPYGGVDLNAASALFGQSIQQGDTAMGIASGAKLGLGLARNFMSGYSAGKDRNRVLNDYSSNMRNAMTGAETPNQLYQEGGTVNEQDQLLQQIAMMLQQGLPPEQVMQELVSMGMPQDQAMQVVQMVMQQSQAPQQEQVPQEQQMMQEGGVATQPEVPVEMANAEIEDGEYVQDGEGVKYAEGAKHSEGGIPTQLENGARVLSDYKKVGKDLAKQFSEQLGFEVKASDTFATVLDKFNRKEGFDKKVKHLDEYSDKLEKQEKTVKHDATLALNKQILMEEAQEDTQKLQELVKQQEGLFNMLFEAQEASKGIETEGNFMQEGGTVNDLMAKYNISTEEAMKLVPSFQGLYGSSTYTGNPIGQAIQNIVNPQVNPQVNTSGLSDAEFFQQQAQQKAVTDLSGKSRKYTPEEKNIIKQSYAEIVKDKNSLEELYKAIDSDALVYNEGMLQALKEGKKLPLQLQNKDIPGGTYGGQDEARLNGYLYRDALGKDFDPSDPNYVEELYGVITKDLGRQGIKWEGSPFNNQYTAGIGNVNQRQPGFIETIQAKKAGEIDLDKFRKASSGQKQLISDEYGVPVEDIEKSASNVTNKFLKLTPQGQPQAVIPETSSTEVVAETPMEIPTTPVVDVAQDEERNRLNFLNLPDQTPMLPWAMQAPAMLRQTIYAPRWNEISPEQQLTDIQRGRVATAEQMSFLPDSQQASSLFALDANAMAAQNKVRSETERYNQMARERTEAAEADQKTRQSAADVVAAQTYQQQLGNELESNEADWRSWANRVQSNQMNNYLTVQEYNRSNAFNPSVSYDGQGYVINDIPTFTNDASKKYLAEQEKKTKSKKKNPVVKDGGTFRGKKSTKRFGK